MSSRVEGLGCKFGMVVASAELERKKGLNLKLKIIN